MKQNKQQQFAYNTPVTIEHVNGIIQRTSGRTPAADSRQATLSSCNQPNENDENFSYYITHWIFLLFLPLPLSLCLSFSSSTSPSLAHFADSWHNSRPCRGHTCVCIVVYHFHMRICSTHHAYLWITICSGFNSQSSDLNEASRRERERMNVMSTMTASHP